ncbi:MAG: hypothetical protein AAF620_18615, partial [Bacteroidota bacterium]
ESFAKLDFWLKSRLSEFQKRSLLVVNEAFEILSNEELGQKAGFSKDSIRLEYGLYEREKAHYIARKVLFKLFQLPLEFCHQTLSTHS